MVRQTLTRKNAVWRRRPPLWTGANRIGWICAALAGNLDDTGFSGGPLWSEPKISRGLLPGLTPIRQALSLTPELLPAFAHPSAALRTHTIQNAGDHIRTRPDYSASYEAHTNLPMTITSAVREPLPSRRGAPGFRTEAKSPIAEAFIPPK
jgi:hypothetical protein